jgi:nicotinamide mononucleotide transporter PnuC
MLAHSLLAAIKCAIILGHMREKFKRIIKYFTPFEWAMWLGGILIILIGFLLGEDKNYLSLLSSILGISCIIFNAKGNVWGQVIAIGFALTYGTLAYTKAYYGEMIIYFALMLPIHIASIVTWVKNKNGNAKGNEVKINSLSKREYVIASVAGCALTVGFYFLLKVLKTDNLIVSTISLISSLAAAYLMLRRCEYFAICFVVIVLWSLKLSTDGISVLPSVLSFIIFLLNDSYSFINWKRIKKRQRQNNNYMLDNEP